MIFWYKALLVISLLSSAISVIESHATYTYKPAPNITMTGANSEVFFDVEDEIYTAGSSIQGPSLDTVTATFSGAFYLSGAGWVDFSTGSYIVDLDCGAQSLTSLSLPCTLSGVAYSETIGDVVFDRHVLYHPDLGELSGTASTFLGEYDFSGVQLPLLPAFFTEGTGSVAHDATPLTISGGTLRYGDGAWQLFFQEKTTLNSKSEIFSAVDLSLAGEYTVQIIDPQGSETEFDYTVTPGIPQSTLTPGPYRHETFCTTHPASSLCPDGVTLKPTLLSSPGGGNRVANGVDAYDFVLTLRDTYGNQIADGQVQITYQDGIRTIQADSSEYMNILDNCIFGTCGLITTGVMVNSDDGKPTSGFVSVLGGLSYSIASIAPTSPSDAVSLSGVIYRDKNNIDHDITLPAWKAPLDFTPWYTTALAASPIVVGGESLFTTSFTHTTTAPSPTTSTAIYHIDIGSNTLSSYKSYTSPYDCTKDVGDVGIDECFWSILPNDTSIIATDASTFSGTYTAGGGYDPPPETVSYRSYIRYSTGGVVVLYPSTANSLGTALPGPTFMKVFGSQNLEGSAKAIGSEGANIWNTLRKNIALLSRNRTDYSDVNYTVLTGNQSINDNDFGTKRTIVVIGGDATLTSDITARDYPVSLIVLSGDDGNGGEIIIDPSVRDIEASLYAEKIVGSSGDNQLYIHGSVISHNTVSSSKCPYFVTGVCDPELYNLQKIREGYLALPDKTGYTAASPRALEHPDVSVIIEYDGRVLSDPPPILEK